MDGLFAHVHRATERTLVANGISITPVVGQGCCGALHAHSGQIEKARDLARANVRAFAALPQVPVVVNSAGCGAILKEYGELLTGDPLEGEARELAERVRDVSEVLAQLGPREGAAVRLLVAYDPPCHLLHAQRVAEEPVQVLQSVPGLELLTVGDADQCCGSAGSYSLTEAALSRSILDRKISALIEAQPDLVATGNPGCIMQIGAGLRAAGSSISVAHPVELLDLSYRRAGFYGA
jgi:glycolate oxidase iron-sulfur subunit